MNGPLIPIVKPKDGGEVWPNLRKRENIKKAETLYSDEVMKAEARRRELAKPDPDWPDCPDCQQPMDRLCKPGNIYEYRCKCGTTSGEFTGL